MSTARRRVGMRGEELAARWYEAHGYRVVARNWRCAEGEIDIVCRRASTLVFCEVKFRRGDDHGSALEAVTSAKQRRVRRLAARWLRVHHVHCDLVRFDVAAVHADVVEVVTDAW